jgi:hypothetical protein
VVIIDDIIIIIIIIIINLHLVPQHIPRTLLQQLPLQPNAALPPRQAVPTNVQ